MRGGVLRALTGVSFAVRPREIVGVVGESGCGKSTLASALLRLLPPNGEIRGGSVVFREPRSARAVARRRCATCAAGRSR